MIIIDTFQMGGRLLPEGRNFLPAILVKAAWSNSLALPAGWILPSALPVSGRQYLRQILWFPGYWPGCPFVRFYFLPAHPGRNKHHHRRQFGNGIKKAVGGEISYPVGRNAGYPANGTRVGL